MNIFQIIAIGVLGTILSITIKKQSPEIAITIGIVTTVIIFITIIPLLGSTIEILTQVGNLAEGHGQYVSLALRVVGVAYMTELGASVCKDAGEGAIATKIDMAGRIIILAMAMPVVADILRIVSGLLP